MYKKIDPKKSKFFMYKINIDILCVTFHANIMNVYSMSKYSTVTIHINIRVGGTLVDRVDPSTASVHPLNI